MKLVTLLLIFSIFVFHKTSFIIMNLKTDVFMRDSQSVTTLNQNRIFDYYYNDYSSYTTFYYSTLQKLKCQLEQQSTACLVLQMILLVRRVNEGVRVERVVTGMAAGDASVYVVFDTVVSISSRLKFFVFPTPLFLALFILFTINYFL